MARPRKPTPSARIYVTIDADEGRALKARALELRIKPATLASQLIRIGLQRPDSDRAAAEAIASATARLDGKAETLSWPRWTWPLPALLADRGWWDRWLPELNELLGRGLVPTDTRYGERAPIRDRRGSSDLLEFLFPIVSTVNGAVTWQQLEYRAAAARNGHEGSPSVAELYDSVIRHVAEALSALEDSSRPGASGAGRIAAEEQILGPWFHTLLSITGQAQPASVRQLRRLV